MSVGLPTADAAAGNGARSPLRLGGMAFRNGLLIHGPSAWAIAARSVDGEIRVASGRKPTIAPSSRVPMLRGPLKLLEGFAVIPLARRRLPDARLPFEDSRVLLAALLTALVSGTLRRGRAAPLVRETLAAALGTVPAVVALRGSELAAYHGVEHKAIGAYERGSLDPSIATKEHERCGSHLIAPLLVLSIAGQLILERLLEHPGPLARGAAGLASVSGAVELFSWADRHPDSRFARLLRRPGTEIQRRFATREPTGAQLEVGSAALAAVLRAEAGGTDGDETRK